MGYKKKYTKEYREKIKIEFFKEVERDQEAINETLKKLDKLKN